MPPFTVAPESTKRSSGATGHTLVRWLHFGPKCDVRKVSETEFDIFIGERALKMRIVPGSSVRYTLYKGDASAKQGWTSPAYDQLVASPTLRIEETASSGVSKIIFERVR